MYTMIQKNKKEELGFKFKPINLKQKRYDYGNLHNEISDDDFDDYYD